MKTTLLPLLLVSAVALSGCGKKKEETPPPPPAQTAAKPQPGVVDQAKQTAADVAAQAQKAGEQVVEKGKEVVAQTTEQAKAAAAQVEEKAKQAVDQAKTEVRDLTSQFTKPKAGSGEVTGTVDKVVESAKSLLGNPQVSDPIKAELTKLVDSVTGAQDGTATAALSKIVSLKPSDDQMGVVKELQSNLGVLVLGRNFDANDPASGGAVKSTIDALKAKDTTAIVSGLQKLGSQAKLTDAQKGIVTNLIGSYGGKLASVTDSVNKATDALKGFGL